MSFDIKYCYEHCPIGKEIGSKYLELNDSIFDAAADFQCFTENCFKACHYKQAHINNKDRES